jgi:hypothetical protein
VFLGVVALGGLVAWLAFLEPPPGVGGGPHPELATMRQGGDGSRAVLGVGWVLGGAIILCFSALVHFGAVRGAGRASLGHYLRVVTLLYLGAWSWLVWTYRAGLEGPMPDLVLALPPATAIMLFVFWPISMLFAALFVLGYRRWVLTPEEEEAFERLVRDHRPPA